MWYDNKKRRNEKCRTIIEEIAQIAADVMMAQEEDVDAAMDLLVDFSEETAADVEIVEYYSL